MRNTILTIAAVLICSLSMAQGLSEGATSLKYKYPNEFNKIELIVQQYDKETDPIYNIMVNAQVKAREKIAKYIGTIKTKDKIKEVRQYMELSQEVINSENVINWILLAKFLGV